MARGANTAVGRLGAPLILQRAVDEEVTAFLRRARYERTPDAVGSRNGVRPRRLQTAEGELTIQMPQVRDAGLRLPVDAYDRAGGRLARYRRKTKPPANRRSSISARPTRASSGNARVPPPTTIGARIS